MRRQANLPDRCATGEVWKDMGRIYLGLVREVKPATGTVGVELADGSQPVQAAVLAPNAASASGLVWLPQVGDLVAVAFAQGHKAMPIILGSIYAANDTLHAQNSGDMTLRHQSGSTVVIANDGTVTVAQAAGAFLKLTPDGDVEMKHSASNADILLDASGAQFSLGNLKVRATAASVFLDANSGSGGAKIEVFPDGHINITPGGSGLVNVGGSTTFVARDGDHTSSPVGAGVADHYHIILGSSTKLIAG